MTRRGRLLTATVAAVAFTSPIVGAEAYTHHAAEQVVRDQAELYARDTLHRSDATTRQIDVALARLDSSPSAPCSPAQRELMRDIDLSSSYLQAVGRVQGTRLVCSSLTDMNGPLDLGPVDFRSPSGVALRDDVHLRFTPGSTFIVAERAGYAAIVHKALPIDVTTESSGVGLATIALPGRQVISQRNDLDVSWFSHVKAGTAASFISHGQAVATVGSGEFYIASVAALPRRALTAQLESTRLYVLPLGLVISLLLMASVLVFARQRASMPAELRAGLRRGELFLEYQPIVDLASERCVGAEALLRWRKRDGTLVPPNVFIQVAEDNGLIQAVTRRVCDLVRTDAEDALRRHPDFHLAINLAAADIHDGDTVGMLTGLSAALGAARGQLVVELTERSCVEHEAARPVLAALRAAGLTSAIDDFGTGYSSLATLQLLDLDLLKIDKVFVESIGTEAATSNVVFHIIDMARTLGLRLVAEGVETEEQARVLRDHGVEFGQGWLFGRPMPLADVVALLQARAAVETGNAGRRVRSVNLGRPLPLAGDERRLRGL